MGISRKNVDKTRAKTTLNVAQTMDYLDRWARWIVAQDHPPVVYGAYQRFPSSNLPRPLLGVVLEDGAGVNHWNIGGVIHKIADQQAVILSCAQGSQSGPLNPTNMQTGRRIGRQTNVRMDGRSHGSTDGLTGGQAGGQAGGLTGGLTGGLWISSFDMADTLHTPDTQGLFTDYAFAPFNVKQMPALRQAYLQLFACKQRNDISPCPMHLKAAWLQLLALLQDELRDDSNFGPRVTPRQSSLRRMRMSKAQSTSNAAAHTSRQPPESIARAMDHIHQHYADASITQQTLARVACLDPHHFGRLFKASLGQTPMRYLRQTRLRQAAFLLINTSKNIATITREVGLSEPQHLARLFGEMYNASPSSYRKAGGRIVQKK